MRASLDIVIPTYNRPDLLEKTLASIARASQPEGLVFSVIVVDNNSKPANAKSNQEVLAKFASLNIRYLVEAKQGRSCALNTGIDASRAEYVGFIDDDEKVDVEWIRVAAEYLVDSPFHYIGGPCKPDWSAPPPEWLPVHCGQYAGVLGWIEQSSTAQPFDAFGGTLCGGNSIIRRDVLNQIGKFSIKLGRSGSNLMGGEDEELQRALRANGMVGIYDPRLIIYHLIPQSRMTRRYHMKWAFWSGVSNGSRSNWEKAETVSYIFGLPRYRIRLAINGLVYAIRNIKTREKITSSKRFASLMDGIYLTGMLYGKYFYKQKF